MTTQSKRLNAITCFAREEQKFLISNYSLNINIHEIPIEIFNKKKKFFLIIIFFYLIKIFKQKNIEFVLIFGEKEFHNIFLILVSKLLKVKVICFQWAISFENKGYKYLHSKIKNRTSINSQSYLGQLRELFLRTIFMLFLIKYKKCIYFGDGMSDYLITFGPHWKNKFKKENVLSENKFINGYFPKKYIVKNFIKQKVLLILGAGNEIYSDSIKLQDWLNYLEDLNVIKDELTVRLHPKSCIGIKNVLKDKGIDVSCNTLSVDLSSAKLVFLDRSTILLDCIKNDIPFAFYKYKPNLFINLNDMILENRLIDQINSFICKNKYHYVGDKSIAHNNLSNIIKNNIPMNI